jgi:hypothetical protein
MAKLIQQFNARNFDPEQGVGGFPIGNHLIKNIASEVKATKAGDGGYLQFTGQILDGEHAGTTGAIRINLYSASPDAARIAHGQFSAMCHVCNVMDVQDSSQLHEIPYRIEVGLQKEPNPNKYTEVKKFYDVNGQAPSKNGPQGGGQQQQNNGGFGGQQQGGNNGNMGNPNSGNAGQQGGNGQWGGNGGGQPGGQPDNNAGQQGGNMGNGTGGNGGNGGGQSWGNGAQQGGGNGGQWGNQGGGQPNGQQPGNQGNSWGNAQNNGAANNGGQSWGSRQ